MFCLLTAVSQCDLPRAQISWDAALKTESRQDANFVIIGGIGHCHNDNHLCHH